MSRKGTLSIHSENIFPIIKNGFTLTTIFLHENLFLMLAMLFLSLRSFVI